MIANYGYKDGSGEYYISINTDHCAACPVDHACTRACPKDMYEIVTDDYDDEMSWIKPQFRRSLPFECAICKPSSGYETLPCTSACTPGAIKHSW